MPHFLPGTLPPLPPEHPFPIDPIFPFLYGTAAIDYIGPMRRPAYGPRMRRTLSLPWLATISSSAAAMTDSTAARAMTGSTDRTAETGCGGGIGDDTLDGGNGNDRIGGGADQETVSDWGSGRDELRGGAGDDTYFVASSGDVVIEGRDEGTDTVRAVGSYTLPDNVERLTLLSSGTVGIGNTLGNTLVSDGLRNTLRGGRGDDWYHLSADTMVVELAGQGRDTVVTGAENYALPDHVEDLEFYGSSTIARGNGLANTISYFGDSATVRGEGGDDTLKANPPPALLSAGRARTR